MKNQKASNIRDMDSRIIGTLKDPLTYIGLGLSAAPALASYATGTDFNSLNSGEKVLCLLTSFTGNVAVVWSYTRNGANPIALFQYRRELKQIEEAARSDEQTRLRACERWWNYFDGQLSRYERTYERTGIEAFHPLIERGKDISRKRDLDTSMRFIMELGSEYNRQRRLLRRNKPMKPIEVSVIPAAQESSGDGVYSLVPLKTYKNVLTEGQQRRLSYFTEDVEGLVPDADQRAAICRAVKTSGWHNARLTDMQTYMLFDDITSDVREGKPLSAKTLIIYVNNLLK